MTNWIYLRSEPGLWTVGFYDPEGRFQTDSDHIVREDAARRVAYLNGGAEPPAIDELESDFRDLVVRYGDAQHTIGLKREEPDPFGKKWMALSAEVDIAEAALVRFFRRSVLGGSHVPE